MKKKIDWKIKFIVSMLCGVILVIGLLFGTTYNYFLGKLEDNDERIAYMTFQESEQKLKEMMEKADGYINRFANNVLPWQFTESWRQNEKEQAVTKRKIIQQFDEILSSDTDIYAVAIVNGSGRTVVSTAERKSRSGNTRIDDEFRRILMESRENYPYVLWLSSGEITVEEDSTLYAAVNRPVLIGIKPLNEEEEQRKDSYLIVTLDERQVQTCYNQAIYNDSQAVLTDQRSNIISATEPDLIGEKYEADSRNQNVSYDLSYNGWTLVNMIPKESYLQEGKEIRNFGLMVGALAVCAVLIISSVWSRRYTRPIQNLMDRMESVGKEQLDLPLPEKKGWPELDRLNVQFYQTVQKLKGYIAKLQDTEQEKAREELLALQYQMNPHFLYNSLNTIRWMAMMTNNTRVADSLVTLSKIIMPILRDPSFTWKLADELEFLKNYIGMMMMRYGDAFSYEMGCPEMLYEEEFPRFILQPVIENCFVHGKSQGEMCRIQGSIRKREGRFFIKIRNSGASMDPEKIKELNESLEKGKWTTSSVGLSNIRKRLRMLYGDSGLIRVEAGEESGTVVYIEFMPQRELETEENVIV